MKRRLLFSAAAILVALSGFSQELKSVYHWTGTADGMSVDLILAERSDGMLAGQLVTVEDNLTLEHEVYGFTVMDSPGNLVMDSYYLNSRSYTIPGKINASGDLECWLVPDNGGTLFLYNDKESVETVLKKTDAPAGFENPFKHASYKEMKRFSEYYISWSRPVDLEPEGRSLMTLSDRKGKLIFSLDAEGAPTYGDLRIGDDEANEKGKYVAFRKGFHKEHADTARNRCGDNRCCGLCRRQLHRLPDGSPAETPVVSASVIPFPPFSSFPSSSPFLAKWL